MKLSELLAQQGYICCENQKELDECTNILLKKELVGAKNWFEEYKDIFPIFISFYLRSKEVDYNFDLIDMNITSIISINAQLFIQDNSQYVIFTYFRRKKPAYFVSEKLPSYSLWNEGKAITFSSLIECRKTAVTLANYLNMKVKIGRVQ
jgi:hypothetical protein